MPHFIPVQARDTTSAPSRLESPPSMKVDKSGGGLSMGVHSRGDMMTLGDRKSVV